MKNKIRVIVTKVIPGLKIKSRILLEGEITLPSRDIAFNKEEAIRIVRENESFITSVYGCLRKLSVGVKPEISTIEDNVILSHPFLFPREKNQTDKAFSTICYDFVDDLKNDLKV